MFGRAAPLGNASSEEGQDRMSMELAERWQRKASNRGFFLFAREKRRWCGEKMKAEPNDVGRKKGRLPMFSETCNEEGIPWKKWWGESERLPCGGTRPTRASKKRAEGGGKKMVDGSGVGGSPTPGRGKDRSGLHSCWKWSHLTFMEMVMLELSEDRVYFLEHYYNPIALEKRSECGENYSNKNRKGRGVCCGKDLTPNSVGKRRKDKGPGGP